MTMLPQNHSNTLRKSYGTLERQLTEADQLLARLKADLTPVHEALQIPVDLQRIVQDFEDVLTTVERLLVVAMAVPPISASASNLHEKVARVNKRVKRVNRQLKKLNDALRPLREKIGRFIKIIDAYRAKLARVRTFLELEHARVNSSVSALDGSEDGRYRRIMNERLEELAENLERELAPVLKVLPELLKVSRVILDLCAVALKPLSFMRELGEIIKVIREILAVLIDPLEELKAAMDTRIGIGPVSISIGELLDAPGSIPFKDEFMSLAMDVLKPIFSKLGLDVDPNAPGLELMQRMQDELLSTINRITDLVRAGEQHMQLITESKAPETTFRSFDAS
jgi:chaperonin cofactor prefoldin